MSTQLRCLVLAMLAIWIVPASASAQSFSCRDAFTPDEILICERPGLKKLDRELHALFVAKRDTASRFLRRMIREEHEAWRRSRHRCRTNVRCIRTHYRARLRELQVVLRRGAQPILRAEPETEPSREPAREPSIAPEREPERIREPQIQSGCTVYRDPGFRGENAHIEPNLQLAFFSGGWNDAISSLQVSDGCELVAHKNSLFRGDSIRFRQAARSLNADWNDRISSLECSCR